MCSQKGEKINKILSECKMLAQKEYKRRHDNIARLVRWKLCCKYDMSRGEKWYEHQPEGVVENKKCKILWDSDMTIQYDNVIEARRPDIVVVEKENNKAIIVDIASPWDHGVYEEEGEKIENIRTLREKLEDHGGLGIWKQFQKSLAHSE